MALFTKIFGGTSNRHLKPLYERVQDINGFEPTFQEMTPDQLREVTQEFKVRLAKGETLDDLLPEAYAAVREATRRTLGKRHYDVQLMGGIVLHQGKIAEMRTGEGKTQVATLPLYLNSLAGKGAHLVTPNDYLSRVGAGWMGPIYHALGVSVAVIAHELSGIYDPSYTDPHTHGDERLNHFRPCTRHEAYMADITYGTNNEYGFDYLRDNLETSPAELRQRDPYFAIVDEIDSILIDEARTPLIISMPDEESADLYKVFAGIVPKLKENEDYNVDEKMKSVSITEEGIDNVERLLNVSNIYEEKGLRYVRYLESALRAQALYQLDRHYVVKDGQVIIVDEFTGRLMPGRRWAEGLHQAVEAKEGVTVERESRTLATITFQNYFRMYEKLAGMTGTAETSAEEFHKVYNLEVVTIPTHRPMVRDDMPDQVFQTEKGKFKAVVKEVKERYEKGQPVLIGTVSIEKNEYLSKLLQVEGIRHEMLNAKNHEREAMIIAQAGRKGAVTVATNMAGRGVDILLGGALNALDSRAERGGNFPEENDAAEVRKLGGLHVIGTERHEARRIDNQLRGRSGRQGDPGSSQFFVSFEDDLMRIFASASIKGMMDRIGVPEEQPIENRMVTRAIESAQTKIEGFHFDSRKHVLEFDDVLNKQRTTIYRMRREILMGQQISSSELRVKDGETDDPETAATMKQKILEMIDEDVVRIIEFHTQEAENWNTEEIFEAVNAIVPVETDIRAKMDIRAKLIEIATGQDYPEVKREVMIEMLMDVLRRVYDIREAQIGQESMHNIERAVMLRSIDMLWMDHLDQMEHLRDSVRLRAYGQREPLVEYKNEGSRLFRDLQAAIRTQIVNTIFKIGTMPSVSEPRGPLPLHLHKPEAAPLIGNNQQPSSLPNITSPNVHPTYPHTHNTSTVPAHKEPNRNDPCPCGSGKKYKKCHGA